MKKLNRKPKKAKLPRRTLVSRFDWVNRFSHWWLGSASVKRSLFRVTAAWQTIAVLTAVLVAGYIMAAIYIQSGEFIISLDQKMVNDGFVISETTDFSEQLITLYGSAAEDVDNISIYDLDRNVMNVDGDHNGLNYVAYTFYLKNETGEEKDYQYELQIRNKTEGVEEATWIMVFKNGKQLIYAKAAADGNAESQYSDVEFPFMEYSDDATQQTYDSKNQQYKLTAIPFEASDMVCSGVRPTIQPDEVDKYTVVIWVEGEDPECVDDIIGGYIELTMKFLY